MLDCNLEYFRTFYFVAKLHSFTKAAQALYISQPAVSQSIQKLEHYFHCTLFVRRQHEIQLTEEGFVLFQFVSSAIDQLLSGEQKLAHISERNKTSIRISATETPLHLVVFPAIDLFRQRYPECSIFFTSGGSAQSCAEDLRNGTADIAMGVTPSFPHDDFAVYQGACVESIAAASPQYPLPHAPLTIQQLAEQTLICTSKGTSARAQLDLWFLEHGILIEPAYSVQTTSTILSLAEKGMGIGILPAYFAQNSIDRGKLVQIPLCQPLPQREIMVAHHTGLANHSMVLQFIDLLIELNLLKQE